MHYLCASTVTLQVSLESRGPEAFKTPRGVCVPFGSMELALASCPAAEQQRFASLLAASESAGLAQLEDIAEEMQVGDGCCKYSTPYWAPTLPLSLAQNCNRDSSLLGWSWASVWFLILLITCVRLTL